MIHVSPWLGLAVPAFALVFNAAPARADLIRNGSFEQVSVGSGYTIAPNGSIPGWVSNNNETEIDNSNMLGLINYAGVQSLELNGNTFDTISQTVTGLTAGSYYTLSWAYSGRGGSGNQRMNVLLDGLQVGQNSYTANDPLAWSTTAVIVQAHSAQEVLSFAAVDLGGNPSVGNEVDAVTMTAYVPEPTSAGLFASGLLGLAFIMRCRRAQLAARAAKPGA